MQTSHPSQPEKDSEHEKRIGLIRKSLAAVFEQPKAMTTKRKSYLAGIDNLMLCFNVYPPKKALNVGIFFVSKILNLYGVFLYINWRMKSRG